MFYGYKIQNQSQLCLLPACTCTLTWSSAAGRPPAPAPSPRHRPRSARGHSCAGGLRNLLGLQSLLPCFGCLSPRICDERPRHAPVPRTVQQQYGHPASVGAWPPSRRHGARFAALSSRRVTPTRVSGLCQVTKRRIRKVPAAAPCRPLGPLPPLLHPPSCAAAALGPPRARGVGGNRGGPAGPSRRGARRNV